MVAQKFYEDDFIDNASWAQIGGMNLDDLNMLEKVFLDYMDYNVNIDVVAFFNYARLILSYAVQNNVITIEVADQIYQDYQTGVQNLD
jgi:hypothetical protein